MAKGKTGDESEVLVEVLVDNLGPRLLQKGDKTSDPEIVALLDDPRELVRRVES
jgi:hypothetical protein